MIYYRIRQRHQQGSAVCLVLEWVLGGIAGCLAGLLIVAVLMPRHPIVEDMRAIVRTIERTLAPESTIQEKETDGDDQEEQEEQDDAPHAQVHPR